jgi:16S rRNA processing protein RimM
VRSPDDLVVVGRIRRAHGVFGVVVVEAMTASAADVFVPGRQLIAGTTKPVAVVPEKMLRVEMAEPFQGGFRVQFDAISGRNEADRWRNRYVLSPRSELPEPGENEIYLHDLIGLVVLDRNGEAVGQIEAYYELPQDIMIEVARAEGSVMIPYRFVTEVDIEGKRVVVDPPEWLL